MCWPIRNSPSGRYKGRRRSHHARRAAAAGRNADRRYQFAAHDGAAVHRQADRAGDDLRRPGGDRDRERAPVRRGAGAHARACRIAGAADGDHRGARRHLTLAGRCSARARRRLPERGAAVRGVRLGHLASATGDHTRCSSPHHGPITRRVSPADPRDSRGPDRFSIGGPCILLDMQTAAAEFPETSANARRWGFRTTLCVP